MLDLIHVRARCRWSRTAGGGPVRGARRKARACALGALRRSRPRSPRRHERPWACSRRPGTRSRARMAETQAGLPTARICRPHVPDRWQALPGSGRQRGAGAGGRAGHRLGLSACPRGRRRAAGCRARMLSHSCSSRMRTSSSRWRNSAPCAASGPGSSRPAVSQPKPIRLHAETAWRMTTRRDPWVNMLRTTVATFSAGLGGADSITVLPFTAALGLPDAFARRVARNTHLILIEEANLARVADPASGAGGFEALTDALCEKAWGLFQAIERDGGHRREPEARRLPARDRGGPAPQRDKAIADPPRSDHRNERVSEHCAKATLRCSMPSPIWTGRKTPRATRQPSSDRAVAADELSSTWWPRQPTAQPSPNSPARPRAPRRWPSNPCRRSALLRHSSACAIHPTRFWRRTGTRPRVFLATLGKPAAYTARAGFAKNFFEAGGIEAVIPDGNHEPRRISRGVSSRAKRRWSACARPTRSMPRRAPQL